MKSIQPTIVKFLSILLVLIFSTGMAFAAEKVIIGFSGAITGPTSDAGVPYSQGVEDYCKYTNDNKILKGYELECLIRDDGYKNEVTKRNFEEYVEAGIAVFLGYSTGSTLALKKDFEDTEIPVIPASMHADNLKDSNYIFLPIATYSEQVLGLAEYIAKNHKGGKAKVALFIHPSAFGRAPVEDLKKAITNGLNIELVEIIEHANDLDNSAMLQRLASAGVGYVISQTVQSPVASMLKDAKRLDLIGKFGDKNKMVFLGAHYTGGNDLIGLAGDAADGFYWTTSYRLTNEKSEGSDFMKGLAKKYGRDEKTMYSHNYTNGVMVTQLAVEGIRRVIATKEEITGANIADKLSKMNGSTAYDPKTTVGPVTFTKTDHSGVDALQLYVAKKGVFVSEGKPFKSQYYGK